MKDRAYHLLRWSERHMRTDMVYLAHGGTWLTIGMGVSMAGGFALSLAFGNLITPEVFGNYKFVLSVAGLIGTFSLTAIGQAVTQSVARGHTGVLPQGFRIDLLWNIPMSVLMLAGAGYYLWNDNIAIALSLLIIAIAGPFLSAYNLYASYLQGVRDFRRATLYGFAIDILTPIALIAVMLSSAHASIPAYIAAYYAVMLALSVFFYTRASRAYPPTAVIDPQLTQNAMHLSFMNVLGRVASYVDKILVFHFLGAAPLAIYTFAAAPPQYVLRFNGVFRTLALPKLAARDIPTLKLTLPRKIALHFLAAAAVTGIYILMIPYFFQIFFPQYIESIPYARALGLMILSAPGVLLGQTLIAHMRKRELYIINTVMPIIKMGLYASLIPFFGIWGVVWATIVSGLIGIGVGFWVFKQLR